MKLSKMPIFEIYYESVIAEKELETIGPIVEVDIAEIEDLSGFIYDSVGSFGLDSITSFSIIYGRPKPVEYTIGFDKGKKEKRNWERKNY